MAVSKFALFSYKQLNSDVNLAGFIPDPAPTFLLVQENLEIVETTYHIPGTVIILKEESTVIISKGAIHRAFLYNLSKENSKM